MQCAVDDVSLESKHVIHLNRYIKHAVGVIKYERRFSSAPPVVGGGGDDGNGADSVRASEKHNPTSFKYV